MDDNVSVLVEVCRRLELDDRLGAEDVLDGGYPFTQPTNAGRNYSLRQMATQFLLDGFIDRYSGDRLVAPPVLRLLSLNMPDKFPYHRNWKMTETHSAYWDLCPTIDHVIPVAREGVDDPSNWATTSMARNAAKGSSTLDQIGWTLYPPGDLNQWDGLTSWFTRYVSTHPEHLTNRFVSDWSRALTAAALD